MADISMVYITFPDEDTAISIGKALLEEQLIACINIFPIRSLYRWEGEILNDKEWIGLVKTTRGLSPKVREKVTALHPYETPCILHADWEANLPYFQWLLSVTAS